LAPVDSQSRASPRRPRRPAHRSAASMAPRRAVRSPVCRFGAACALAGTVARVGTWSATFVALGRVAPPARAVARRAGLDLSDPAKLEEMMKDPEKLKQIQAEAEKIAKDPAKMQAMQKWQEQIASGVDKLKQDPEMKQFFEDIEKEGMAAFKKYEKDERILKKFSEATGGPEALGMSQDLMSAFGGGAGGAAATAPGQVPSYKPGDEVIIKGLQAKPELNGKKAMVVPPTTEERESLAGTGRLIVRLLDTGDQFAVKPDNLRTTAQEADELMTNKLEDISVYNPALQSEAAKLRESGKLEDLQNDPELQPIFADIKKNGMAALEKYWDDDKLMAKISKAMGTR